jgi:hypothetical protein
MSQYELSGNWIDDYWVRATKDDFSCQQLFRRGDTLPSSSDE